MTIHIKEEHKPLAYSLGMHFMILIIAIVRPYFSSEVKPFQSSIKVDVIAMPEKNQKIIKKPEEEKPKAEKKKEATKTKEKKAEPKKVEKKVVATPAKAKAKPKAEPVVEDKSLEMDAFAKLAKIKQEETIKEEEQKAIAGNRVSKGTDLTGVEKIEYSNYRSTLHKAISEEWDVPKWLLEGNLSAVAHIKIDESGNLISKKIMKSSGNSIYDEKVMEAIVDAAPFSPPPEKFKKIVYYEGVELSFPR